MFNLRLKEALYKGEVELQSLIEEQKKQLDPDNLENIIAKTTEIAK